MHTLRTHIPEVIWKFSGIPAAQELTYLIPEVIRSMDDWIRYAAVKFASDEVARQPSLHLFNVYICALEALFKGDRFTFWMCGR